MPVLHNLYLPCDCMTVQEPVDLLRLAHCIVCRLCRPQYNCSGGLGPGVVERRSTCRCDA